MDIVELIRNADSAPEVLRVLSAYVEILQHDHLFPDWCLQLPLEGEADVRARMLAVMAVVSLTSRNLCDQECNIAKGALRVFAAALWRLRLKKKPG